MNGDKHWTEANIPKWAKENIDAEIEALRITAALSWPTEQKPEPLPFGWGAYDHCHGDPVEGDYWLAFVGRLDTSSRVSRVSIRRNQDGGWKKWQFREGDDAWTTRVVRGPLFATERDARLWALWGACETCAKALAALRKKL